MKNKKALKKTLLLSYPRCGNTLMRYFLEFVTSQATEGYRATAGDADPLAVKYAHITVDFSLPKIFKRHHVNHDVNIFNDHPDGFGSQDRLILLLRNPMESLIRASTLEIITEWAASAVAPGLVDSKICAQSQPHHRYIENYFNNIKFYDKYWLGEKQIFYYEDGITDPETYWKSVNNFVGGSEEKIKHFLENLDWHLEESFLHYYKMGKPRLTHGKKVLSHSLPLDSKQRRQIKNKILLYSRDLKSNHFISKYDIDGDEK